MTTIKTKSFMHRVGGTMSINARALLILACLLPGIAVAAMPALQMGTISAEVPATMMQRTEPLAKYLTAHTGIAILPHPGPSHGAVVNDLGKNTTQIAYLTPVSYIIARAQHGVVTLATPLSADGKPTFHVAIVVRKESPFHSLDDLKGKRLALGDRLAFMQPATLYHAGKKLDDFKQIVYLKHHDNVAKAVLNQDFDAGIMPQSHALRYPGLRIIHLSPPVPNYPVVARSDLPHEQMEAIRAALIRLNPKRAEDRAVLNALDPTYTGFAPIQDKDFDEARRMMEPFTTRTATP